MSDFDNHMPMGDIKGPLDVEVQIDKTQPKWRLWVNVDGQCRLRIYGINPKAFTINTYEVGHGRD